MLEWRLASGIAVAGCLGAGVSAQETARNVDRSILRLLPVMDTLSVPDTARGRLTDEDYLVRAGRRVAAWVLRVDSVGAEYTVDLTSSDFDAYLYIVGPSIRRSLEDVGREGYALTDDDSGEGYNARVCFRAPMAENYHVVAGALEADTGEYELQVTPGCHDSDEGLDGADAGGSDESVNGRPPFDPWEVSGARTLRRGIILKGLLSSAIEKDDDGRPIEVWSLPVESTQRLLIEGRMESDGSPLRLRIASERGFGGGVGPNSDWAVASPDGALNADAFWETGGAGELCVLAGGDDEFRVVVSADIGYSGVEESTGARAGEYWIRVVEDPDAMACDTGPASAPHYVDLLTAMSDQGRRIRVGESRRGSFTSQEETDPVFGQPLQRWTVDVGRSVEWITMDVRSDAIDEPRLMVVVANDVQDVASLGNECGHRVNYRVPRAGTYPLIVRAPTREHGEFELSVSPGRDSLTNLGPCKGAVRESEGGGGAVERVLVVGTEIDDALVGYNSRVAWTLQVAAGDSVVVAVDSEAFDTYLEIYGPGLPGGLWDDDGGPGSNSRIVFTVSEDGAYEITVSSFDGGAGRFRLRASRRKGPTTRNPVGA